VVWFGASVLMSIVKLPWNFDITSALRVVLDLH
jgi:hypothetical protein